MRPALRGLRIQFEDFSDVTDAMREPLRAVALDQADADPRHINVTPGEWVLVTLTIGSRSTAAMAVVIEEGASRLAQFDARDWERIQAFALRSQSPPSSRAPRFDGQIRDVHMPSFFPTTAEGLGAPFLQVLHYDSAEGLNTDTPERDDRLDAILSSHGMAVESVGTRARCEERLRTSQFHVLLLSMTRGTPELSLLQALPEPRPVVVCLAISAESIDLVRAFEAGADECLPRGTSPSELAARLTALVLRKRSQNPGAA